MKHCVVSIIRSIASDAEQQLKYRPHPGINAEMLKRIHQEKLGTYKGYTFWLVDGELIRDEVFIDFTSGGNPATYRFVPEHEIWIEKGMDPKGILPTMLHEYLEMCKMKDEGWTYDKAHTYASGVERKVRRVQPTGTPWETFISLVEGSRRIAMKLFEDTQRDDPEILARALMKILKDRAHKSGIDPRKVFEMFTRLRP